MRKQPMTVSIAMPICLIPCRLSLQCTEAYFSARTSAEYFGCNVVFIGRKRGKRSREGKEKISPVEKITVASKAKMSLHCKVSSRELENLLFWPCISESKLLTFSNTRLTIGM